MTEPIWTPPPDAWATTRLGRFAARHCPEAVGDYEALLAWSIERPAAFWSAVADELAVDLAASAGALLVGDTMPGVRWFPDATVNYAEHVLRGGGLADDDVVAVSVSQSRPTGEVRLGELRDQVRRVAAGLRKLGVGPGDRVAAFLPNIDETVVAFLATASIGAVWSSCAPEFGVRAVLDRWSQIEPTVLLTIDGYGYGDQEVPLDEVVAGIRAGLPSLRATVVLPYLGDGSAVSDALPWDELASPTDDELTFEPVPFDHPLYVLYSSGTTGLPKAIVHGHGGILLEHGKQLALQTDLGTGDRFFWFSTTGWMMWNYLVSAPLVGASIVLFDGNPGHPDLDTLWSLVAETGTTVAGLSAPFLLACRRAGVRPAADHDLSRLRTVGSTGAPLPAVGFEWIAAEVGPVHIANISGGTDVCSAFLGSAPVLPVVAGAIPCRQLGWAVDAFDSHGNPVRGVEGELVVTAPAPSMPVELWGDDDGSRYRDTYFSTYPGVWCHGDWLIISDEGSAVVSGRSDATLNRGGVRLGTADYYAVVEGDPAVADSVIVHLEPDADDPDDGALGTLVLFVVPAEGAEIDDDVRARLASVIRRELSPRHVPDRIEPMPIVPRTLSGKKLEVPVKRILQGAPVERVASTGALADARSLEPYVAYSRRSPP